MSKNPSRRSSKGKPSQHSANRNKRSLEYSQLERRQLLATDIGLNLTGHTKGTQSDVVDPNMVGDIGPTHVIESIVDKISIFDRNTGNRTLFKTPNQFWIDIGGTVSSTITNTQVIFDRMANRWFMLGEGSGAGNWLYLAVSNNANPMQGWKALRFVGDSNGVRHNGELNIAVDADALIITSRNTSTVVGFPLSVSIYTIPKVDLYAGNPTLTNMSRFENRSPTLYGDFLRASVSLEASDGQAVILGSRGSNKITTFVNNVGAAGATLGIPRLIDFHPSNLIVDNRDFTLGSQGPFAEQTQLQPGNIDIFVNTNANILPVKNGSDVMSNPYDYKGGLWFVQEGQVVYTGGTTRGIWYYEIDKATNQLLQGGVVPTPALGNPWDWYMYNPGFSINNFGLLQVNYTISSEEFDVTPTAASSIAQSVYGIAIYNPIFDVIGYSNEEPGREGKNTQFERPMFVQDGLSVYQNTPSVVSSWSWRASAGWDPTNYNQFWGSTQWSNTVSRWSTQITHLKPIDMTVEITANEEDNIIVVRRKAGSPELIEVEIDGRVTDILPSEPLGKLVLNGYDGDDIFRLDFTNGDPQPAGGFEFNGMRGADRVETNDINGGSFVVDGNFYNIYGVAGDGSGKYNDLTGFTGIEELHGGPGPDSFEVTDVWVFEPFYQQVSHGFLAGSMVGKGGDDIFKFSETGEIGDSIDGGAGFNTLSFESRRRGGPLGNIDFPVALQLIGPSINSGFDGFAPDEPGYDGPIGDDPNQFGDRFFDIDFIRGSDYSFDDVRGVDRVAYVFVDDLNSYYRAQGEKLGFFQINAISASHFADHFVAINNTVNPLQLNGLAGNDLYDFSSDAPTNNGNTAGLQDLLFAQGGSGANLMNVSNKTGSAVDALILQNRISGLGEIAYNAIGGTFDLNVWASEFADHVDLHSFFFTNTLNLYLLGGDDTISIQDLSKAPVNVYGGLGDDVYTVEKIQGIDLRNLNIIDSIGSERDRVQLAGTILDETFTISESTFADLNVSFVGIEWFGVETRGGNDIINVQDITFELFVNGEDGDDIINISSNAPTNTGTVAGITKAVTIEGGTGRNELRISNLAGAGKNVLIQDDRITGLLPGTLFYRSTGGTFGLTSGIGGIFILGSNSGDDTFTINSLNVDDSLRIAGAGGNDQFVLKRTALGDTQLEGDGGIDQFDVFYVGSGARAVVLKDTTDVPATGRLNLFGTGSDDVISVASAKAVRAGEQLLIQAPLAYFGIDAVQGDDTISVNWTTGVKALRLMGNNGADTITLNTSELSTYVTMLGGAQNDSLNIMTGANSDVQADGETGSDRYFVKTRVAGSRLVDVRDSGGSLTESDIVTIAGQNTADSFEIRSNRVLTGLQQVTFDEKTERLILQTIGGNDTVDVYSSVAKTTQVQAGSGDDKINVFSTTGAAQVTLDGNDGNDSFLVIRTTEGTNSILRGGIGDDRFDIGSSLEASNGNLGSIRGRISAQGNTNTLGGEDRLYLNDFNVNVPYNYVITSNLIGPLAGPNNLPRPQFAGVSFDGTMEFARLDGTIAANFFSVRPSQNTRFYLDGNLPSPIVGSGDYIFLVTSPGDGHELHITDAPRGRGYWDFTNGNKEVRFEEIETTNDGGSSSGIPSAPSFFTSAPNMKKPGSSGGSSPLAMLSSNPMDSLAGSISLADDDDNDSLTFDLNAVDVDLSLVELADTLEFDV